MRKKSGKLLGAMIPAMLLCAPAFASSARSLSRLRGKNLAVKSAQVVADSTQAKTGNVGDPFAVFGDNFGAAVVAPAVVDTDVLAFLKDNGLLRAKGEAVSQVSGEITDAALGRKDFADARLRSHCHVGGWVSYSYTQNSCVSRGGTWDPLPAYPVFENTSVLNKTATSFNVGVDLNKSGTVYAVLVLATDQAPSSAQVKAGQNGSGAAALQAKNLAATTGGFTGTFSFTGLTAGTGYRVYVVGDNGTLAATPVVVNPEFEHGTVFSTTSYYTFPKITASPNGNLYSLFWDSANASYTIDKWNEGTGAWGGYTSFSNANTGTYTLSWGGYDQAAFRVSSPTVSTDNVHMAFGAGVTNMANTYDPYYGLFNGTSWSFSKIYDDLDAPDGFDVFVDSSSKAHVSYNVSATTGYYMRYDSNASTAFPHASTAIQTNSTSLEIGKSFVVRESGGKVNIFYGSEQNPWWMGYYMANSSDSYAAKTLVLDSCPGGGCANDETALGRISWEIGNVVIDSSDKIHLVYSDKSNGRAYYRTNKSGNWVTTELTTSGRSSLVAYDLKIIGTTVYIAMGSDAGYYLKAYDGTTWFDGKLFGLDGYLRQFAISPTTGRVMVTGEVSGNPYKVTYTTGMIADFVTIVAPNTAPTLAHNTGATLTQTTGQTTISTVMLQATDAEQAASALTYTIGTAPTKGTLKYNGAALNAASTFTQANIDSGLITYTPSGDQIGADSFTFSVSDGAGGSIASTAFSITITDSVAPTVSSINRSTPAGAVTNADSLVFLITFSEVVNNLSTDDFVVSGTTATVTDVTSYIGSGVTSAEYSVSYVTVSGGNLASLNGTVTLGFSGVQNITDTAGNPLSNTTPTGTNDNTYTVDNIAPTVVIGSPSSNAITSTATSDLAVTYSGASAINLTPAQVTLSQTGTASCTKSVLNGTTTTPTVRLSACSGDGTVTITLAGASIDVAGNTDTGAAPSSSITVDNTAPTAAISYTPAGPYTKGDTVTITANFSEAVADSPAMQIAASAITGGSALPVTNMTKVSATQYSYSYLVGSGNGSASVTLSAGRDLAGNLITATPASGGSFTVNKSYSTVTLVSSTNPSVVGAPVTFSATVTSGTIVTSGTVDFKDNGALIDGCLAVAISGDTAVCTTSALTQGSHFITAEYGGDSTYNPSTSQAISQTVNPLPTHTVTGSVTLGSGNISCDSPVTSGTPSDCTLTPDNGWYTAGLTDNDVDVLAAIVVNKYTIPSVTVDHAVAATFQEYFVRRMTGSTPAYYLNIADALVDATEGDSILLLDLLFNGDVTFDQTAAIRVEGGYASGFGSSTGNTVLDGTVIVKGGKVVMRGIKVKGVMMK